MSSVRGKLLICAALAVVLGLTGACSGKHRLVKGAPDWVNYGSGAFDDAGSRMFYGVGAVTGITSPSLSKQAAEQRARAEIARQLSSYVSELYRDFEVSTEGLAGKARLEEQHIDNALKSFANVTVRGAKVVEYWRDPESDTLYALATLDLPGIKAAMEDFTEITPEFRGYVREHAERAFTEMSRSEGGR